MRECGIFFVIVANLHISNLKMTHKYKCYINRAICILSMNVMNTIIYVHNKCKSQLMLACTVACLQLFFLVKKNDGFHVC